MVHFQNMSFELVKKYVQVIIHPPSHPSPATGLQTTSNNSRTNLTNYTNSHTNLTIYTNTNNSTNWWGPVTTHRRWAHLLWYSVAAAIAATAALVVASAAPVPRILMVRLRWDQVTGLVCPRISWLAGFIINMADILAAQACRQRRRRCVARPGHHQGNGRFHRRR